jgi:hypothetical protein
MKRVMRRRGRAAWRAAMSASAAAMAAFMRVICAFTLALRARRSAKPGFALASAFAKATADKSPGKPGLAGSAR